MTINIPQDSNWDAPEGNYTLRLIDVQQYEKHITGRSNDRIRLVWEVVNPRNDRYTYQVASNYLVPASGDAPKKLVSDLRTWMGDDLNHLMDGNRKFDLKKLIGRLADGQVEHSFNPSHQKPFVSVVAIAPPGTFTSGGLN